MYIILTQIQGLTIFTKFSEFESSFNLRQEIDGKNQSHIDLKARAKRDKKMEKDITELQKAIELKASEHDLHETNTKIQKH